MKVADLTIDDFKVLIKKAVKEELEEILAVDEDLDLREEIIRELKGSMASKKRLSGEKLAKELGLKW
ncbi:MAG: hypothetical protein HZA78_13310 [Candidatus Schekmanbacteria bacterium]|nr:hypothetical protein [Candidatus Schekmanbacteria bacterium]